MTTKTTIERHAQTVLAGLILAIAAAIYSAVGTNTVAIARVEEKVKTVEIALTELKSEDKVIRAYEGRIYALELKVEQLENGDN